MRNLLIAAVILFSLAITAQEIKAGIYEVAGMDLSTNEAYSGTVYITKVCEVTYGIGWDFGDEKEVGVGIVKDGKLFIVFQTINGVDYGRQVCTIEDGVIKSEWKLFNRECSGTETLTFKSEFCTKECSKECCKKECKE